MTDTERLRRLDRENEELRDMLNQVAWRLGLGDEVHYYADNYLACQLRVLDAIEDLTERESDVETVRSDAMEAWEWVREHGGLSHVKDIYHDLRAVVERLGIEWSESELHVLMDTLDRRLMPEGCDWEFLKLHMSNLRGFMLDVMDRLGVDKSDSDAPEIAFDALDRRIMPEGMEWLVEAWPRFEDGEPVDFGDEVAGDDGDARGVDKVVFYGDQWRLYDRYGCEINEDMMGPGERVRRPAPKVLDADGVEIRVGDVLYRKSDGHMVKVAEVYEKTFTDADDYVRPGDGYTHRVPVFAADVRPLHEGEHVYHVETGAELVVKGLPKPGEYQAVVVFAPPASHLTSFDPDQLTHERPESWERLEEDASKNPFDYCKDVGHRLDTCENSEAYKARDIVRRAKALAGVSE